MSGTSTRIAVRFASLVYSLEPNEADINKARARAHSIVARLDEAFDVVRSQLVGSHTKQTAIRSVSDVDIFVVLSRKSVRWGDSIIGSNTLLDNVREELRARYPHSPVYRSSMAVSISMDEGRSVIDVVPALFKGPHPTAGLCFEIPDGYGNWITTAPDRHLTYFKAANLKSGEKLRRVVQLVKHWCYSRLQPIPLSSFHTEVVLAAHDTCVGPTSYSSVLAATFGLLLGRQGAGIRDPLGVSGVIPATYTDAQRLAITRALEHASHNAALAVEAERSGSVSEAVYRWRQVFNDQFPR